MAAVTKAIRSQLTGWGFMAAEVPGIGARVEAMINKFVTACASTEPSLSDYTHKTVPQLAAGGTDGFFPYNSDIPRLANGVPDPKEFIHVSGAMISDQPPEAGAVRTRSTPLPGRPARSRASSSRVIHTIRSGFPRAAAAAGAARGIAQRFAVPR